MQEIHSKIEAQPPNSRVKAEFSCVQAAFGRQTLPDTFQDSFQSDIILCETLYKKTGISTVMPRKPKSDISNGPLQPSACCHLNFLESEVNMLARVWSAEL